MTVESKGIDNSLDGSKVVGVAVSIDGSEERPHSGGHHFIGDARCAWRDYNVGTQTKLKTMAGEFGV